jgi:hypothetical protein
VPSKEEAARISNLYAPEHLIINTDDAETWLPLITDAGSCFLGRWTPESVSCSQGAAPRPLLRRRRVHGIRAGPASVAPVPMGMLWAATARPHVL